MPLLDCHRRKREYPPLSPARLNEAPSRDQNRLDAQADREKVDRLVEKGLHGVYVAALT